MKLPPDVSFHTERRLMVWRPRGVLDEKMVNQITTFIGSQEATSKTPFDRFTDTTLLDAIDLSFDYVFHVALYRRMSYAGHPKVKSAFLVKWGKSDHEAKLHAFLTERSSLDVRLFEELEAAAKWLNVSAALLQPADAVQKSPTSTQTRAGLSQGRSWRYPHANRTVLLLPARIREGFCDRSLR